MTAPKRIRLSRAKGWRKPDGAIVVARPTKWGNPFPIDGSWIMWTAIALGFRADRAGRRAAAVALHRAWITQRPVHLGPRDGNTDGGYLEFTSGARISMGHHVQGIAGAAASLHSAPHVPERPDLTPLAGHDLACWCPLDQPCHADVLLELANRQEAR